MGIKDWFGGDKKKAALRDKVKEAVSKGRLDTDDLKAIEEARRSLDVTPAADDKTVFRREIYNEAANAVRQDGKVTATDAHELAKIQKFLGLRDDQVEKTKWNLARLRTLTEIRNGTLPTVPPSNVALRGVPLEENEVAHYSISVELFNLVSTRQADGVAMAWGGSYTEGAVGGGSFSASATSMFTCSAKRDSVSTGILLAGTRFTRICSALNAVNCPIE